jgi:uncharacterized membrane protein
MFNLAFAYALLAGVSMATYIIGARIASPGIHPALGTAIITGIAFLITATVTLSIRATGVPVAFSTKGFSFMILVGVATACVNLFTLLAYANGLRVTSSFVIGGTSTALVLLIGFLFLKELFTWTKLFAIGLIAACTFLLRSN